MPCGNDRQHRGFQRASGCVGRRIRRGPEAQYFLSWTWLSNGFPGWSAPGSFFAAREANSQTTRVYFPLRLRTKEWKGGGLLQRDDIGRKLRGRYTGFVCKPEVETDVIKAFAARLKQLNWANVHLENIRTSETRFQRLLNQFPGALFERKEFVRVNKRDNTDNCVCPILRLPDSWEKYLESLPSSNMRQKIRRFLRQLGVVQRVEDHGCRCEHGRARRGASCRSGRRNGRSARATASRSWSRTTATCCATRLTRVRSSCRCSGRARSRSARWAASSIPSSDRCCSSSPAATRRSRPLRQA